MNLAEQLHAAHRDALHAPTLAEAAWHAIRAGRILAESHKAHPTDWKAWGRAALADPVLRRMTELYVTASAAFADATTFLSEGVGDEIPLGPEDCESTDEWRERILAYANSMTATLAKASDDLKAAIAVAICVTDNIAAMLRFVDAIRPRLVFWLVSERAMAACDSTSQ